MSGGSDYTTCIYVYMYINLCMHICIWATLRRTSIVVLVHSFAQNMRMQTLTCICTPLENVQIRRCKSTCVLCNVYICICMCAYLELGWSLRKPLFFVLKP